MSSQIVEAHPFETLALPNGAKLLFTPCPGTKQVNLDESLRQLKQQGVSMLITLMFSKEMVENDISELPELCDALQIKWLQLPIVDDEAPQESFQIKWQKYKELILNEIANKGVVAVHCKGGTGRTGTVISLLLIQLGWSVTKIKQEVQKVKPKALRIQKQLDYLNCQVTMSSERF
ncbi:tyrosine-protein phosphatase [Colwelliaceae bacterium 6471]